MRSISASESSKMEPPLVTKVLFLFTDNTTKYIYYFKWYNINVKLQGMLYLVCEFYKIFSKLSQR